jgi:uncharacterized protein (TIGR04222 family)
MQLFSSWTGSDFLLFYSVLLGLGMVAAWWISANLREAGRSSDSPDPEDVALLAGGRGRHTDTVIADLYTRGGLIAAESNKLAVSNPAVAASPAGRILLGVRQPFNCGEADKLLSVHVQRIAARLRREGLLLRDEDQLRLRWLSIAPFCALLMIGLYRQRAGSALGEPTGFLVMLMVLTVVLALIRFAKSDPRTRAGIEAVRDMRRSASRLSRAPQSGEAALAVALFGTGVLVGTPWEPVNAMRPQSGGDGGGSDGGSSDGGSGCGGGGCGGCGG